ncbi:hypothetical protein GPV39_24525, partial [Salmonella enterica subsp. enterica serovar Typhimurium]|nr:hypothetical protein [Salmonella enterica subsp. enterica serovar Typhimurium]
MSENNDVDQVDDQVESLDEATAEGAVDDAVEVEDVTDASAEDESGDLAEDESASEDEA